MKKQLLVFVLLLSMFSVYSQQYIWRNGVATINSSTPLEAFQGVNNNVAAVVKATTGEMEVQMLIKGFNFQKALMQEHFNENYMETDRYPKAIFKGKITNINTIKFNVPGQYTLNIQGKLTVHGVTKDITTTGTLKIAGGKLSGNTAFEVIPSDYGIGIPTSLVDRIAKKIKITMTLGETNVL